MLKVMVLLPTNHDLFRAYVLIASDGLGENNIINPTAVKTSLDPQQSGHLTPP